MLKSLLQSVRDLSVLPINVKSGQKVFNVVEVQVWRSGKKKNNNNKQQNKNENKTKTEQKNPPQTLNNTKNHHFYRMGAAFSITFLHKNGEAQLH